MKAIKLLFSFVQAALVILYVLFFNAQYFYSLYGTVQNVVSFIAK